MQISLRSHRNPHRRKMSKFNTETTKYEKARTTHGIQKNASYSVQSTPSGGCTPSGLFVASDREDPTGHRSRPKTLVHFFCPETEELMRQQEDVPTTNKHFCICPHFLWDIVLLILCSPAPFFFFPRKTTKGALSYPLTSFEMNSHYRLFRILLCLFFASALFDCWKEKTVWKKGK